MININGSIFEKKNEKTFEYIITPCIRVFDIEDIDYLKESKRILKIIH